MDKETEEKIKQLQLIEQNMQNSLVQKQQIQSQLLEITSASEELKGKKSAYKIIGNIMVSVGKEKLEKEIKEKKKILELRIENLEKQEDRIKQKAKKLQSDVMEKIKDEK